MAMILLSLGLARSEVQRQQQSEEVQRQRGDASTLSLKGQRVQRHQKKEDWPVALAARPSPKTEGHHEG